MKLTFVLTVICGLACNACTAADKDPKAIALIESALQAKGGRSAINRLDRVHYLYEGTVKLKDGVVAQANGEAWFTHDKSRVECRYSVGDVVSKEVIVTVANKVKFVKVNDKLHEVEKSENDFGNFSARCGRWDELAPLLDEKDIEIEYVGTNANNETGIRVSVRGQSDFQYSMYFDSKTILLNRTRYRTISGDGTDSISEDFHSDYRVVNGVRVPFSWKHTSGRGTFERKITRYEQVKEISDKLFTE